MGTTQRGENHTYTLEGVEGTVFLTDTPGLSEIGDGRRGARAGSPRAGRAGRPADLRARPRPDPHRVRAARRPWCVRGSDRSSLLNKTDRFTDADRDAILAKLRERLRGLVPPDDVIAGAAPPRPMPVRVRRDGRHDRDDPRGPAARARRAPRPDRPGPQARGRRRSAPATSCSAPICSAARPRISSRRSAIEQGRGGRSRSSSGSRPATVFTNPFPALELLASGAVQFQMISELANVYGVTLSTSNVRMIGTEMIQMLLKLGLVEATTSLIAGIFKSTMVGYAAGGRRAGRVDGLSDPHLGRDVRRVLPPRPDLGRRRHAGRPDPPVRPHQPRRVPPGIRQAGRAEGLQPDPSWRTRNARNTRRPRIERQSEDEHHVQTPRRLPAAVPQARADDRRHRPGAARGRGDLRRHPQRVPRAGRRVGAEGPRLGRARPRSGDRAGPRAG